MKLCLRVLNISCSMCMSQTVVNSLAGVGEIQSSSAGSGYHDEFRHLNTFSESLSNCYHSLDPLDYCNQLKEHININNSYASHYDINLQTW